MLDEDSLKAYFSNRKGYTTPEEEFIYRSPQNRLRKIAKAMILPIIFSAGFCFNDICDSFERRMPRILSSDYVAGLSRGVEAGLDRGIELGYLLGIVDTLELLGYSLEEKEERKVTLDI